MVIVLRVPRTALDDDLAYMHDVGLFRMMMTGNRCFDCCGTQVRVLTYTYGEAPPVKKLAKAAADGTLQAEQLSGTAAAASASGSAALGAAQETSGSGGSSSGGGSSLSGEGAGASQI